MSDELLTISEAARKLGIHVQTCYRLVWRGVLPATRLEGIGWRVAPAELEKLISRQGGSNAKRRK